MSIYATPSPVASPDSVYFLAEARRRDQAFRIGGALLAVACASIFAALDFVSPLVSLVLVACLLVPVLVWNLPRLPFEFLMPAVCLIELGDCGSPDEFFGKIPLFWNVNTIVQIYAHIDFKAIPFSLLEFLLILTGVLSFVKAVFYRSLHIDVGTLFKPILVYIAFVTIGWANGIATGGDFKISLQEVRSQFYFLIAYLIASHLVRTKKQIQTSLWIFVLCVALKGAVYVFREYVTLHGATLPDQGVGSHEEAFFFGAYTVLLVILPLAAVETKLQKWMWVFFPLVVVGDMVTNRRAGTAGLAVSLLFLFPSAWVSLPHRRKLIVTVALAMGIVSAIYYPAFRNKEGALALPARAAKTQFEPDSISERDRSSNDYRVAENACLMGTIKQSPAVALFGYGYGKRMLHTVQIADITKLYEWWDILPHNQILWVWMRVGSIGFVAFWLMIGSILFEIGRVLRCQGADGFDKSIALFVLIILANLLMFGMLDLQLSNYRDMLFSGLWVGILGGYLSRRREAASR